MWIVSSTGVVWALNSGTGEWNELEGTGFTQVTSGLFGSWALKDGDLYFREGMDNTQLGSEWHLIAADELVYISSGSDGSLWGATSTGAAIYRTGISIDSPRGSDWITISTGDDYHFTQISAGDAQIVALTTMGEAYFRAGVSADNKEGCAWTSLGGPECVHISITELSLTYCVDVTGQLWHLGHGHIWTPPTNVDYGWIQVEPEAIMWQIDAGGQGTVVARDQDDSIFYREGVSETDPAGTGWAQIDGKLNHVTACDDGQIFGVNSAQEIFYRPSTGGDSSEWVKLNGALVQISCGDQTVWGVNTHGNLYRRDGLDTEPTGTAWTQVDIGFSYVAVGPDNSVWGIHPTGEIFYRDGLAENLDGTGWTSVPGQLT